MTTTNVPPSVNPEPSKGLGQLRQILSRGLQWIVFFVAVLIALFPLLDLQRLGVPGAPRLLMFTSIAATVIVAIGHFPKVFWRLSRKGRIGMYVALPVAISFGLFVISEVRTAYLRTPEGAKADAELEKWLAQEAAEERSRKQTEALLAEAARTQAELENYNAKIEACFTGDHMLPALIASVQRGLHNPEAFQHVETVATVPDSDRNNVVMTFRAENGFGAIRTATVKAQLVADGCHVQNVGQPSVN